MRVMELSEFEKGVSTARERGAAREPAALRTALVEWMREQVRRANSSGVVYGLSGGIDSAVVCGICAEAIGAERCLGVIMPIESADEDAELAVEVAERFGVPTVTAALAEPFEMLERDLAAQVRALATSNEGLVGAHVDTAPAGDAYGAQLARGNVKPRLRMLTLYYYANALDRLVIGTGNAAERLVGYFTKYGDAGADLYPLGDLLKREVVALARELDVPERVVTRPPSAGLWAGQTDEAELGLTYEQIDRFLLEGSAGDAAADERIRARLTAARHKLLPVPIARPD